MESTREHVAPYDLTAGGREALKGVSVSAAKGALPGDPAGSLQENLNVDPKIRKGTPEHVEEPPDAVMSPGQLLVGQGAT